MTKLSLRKWTLRIGVFVLFLAITFLTLFYAFGYKYDGDNFEMVETGIVRFSSVVDEAEILMNGDAIASSLPMTVSRVAPGEYSISVVKDGYLPWMRDFEVIPGMIHEMPSVILVPEDIDSSLEFERPYTMAINLKKKTRIGKIYHPIGNNQKWFYHPF